VLVAAMGRNRIIGAHGRLPWRLPADMRFLRSISMNKAVLMGRLTFESIGKPLPQRRNVVISRRGALGADGVEVVTSLGAALSHLASAPEVLVLGGQTLYEQTLPIASELVLTRIDEDFEGDAYFPSFDEHSFERVWAEEHPADDENPHPFRFERWTRRPAA
jgi:dihydrofolate reductase